MTVDLTNPIFFDEDKAREHFEALRWPEGPVCPHCGSVEGLKRLAGKSHRKGLYQCNACREHFTVTVGTVMERSHVPLHKWALGFHLMASSKKGVSAHQLWRTLGLGSYRTAWFMAHRIREAMNPLNPEKIGEAGGVIEIDETFLGKEATVFVSGKGWRGGSGQKKIVTMLERGGRARSVKVDDLTKPEIVRALEGASRNAVLNTDEAQHYRRIGREFAAHYRVNHGLKEWTRGNAYTNSVEGFFSVFKRGMRGVYQQCSEQHLHRYLAEFDFRHSNRIALGVDDTERAARAIVGADGKRLTYKPAKTGNAPALVPARA